MNGSRQEPGVRGRSNHTPEVEQLRSWLDVLGCPDCVWGSEAPHVSTLSVSSNGLVCSGCGHEYPLVDGVIRLVGSHDLPEMWDRQVAFFDTQVDPDFELGRPEAGGRFYDSLIRYRVSHALRSLGESVGVRIVEACCGSGMVSSIIAEHAPAARFLGFDASPASVMRACLRAQRRRYEFVGVVSDAHRPPLRRGVDLTVVIHDALHHLEHPLDALQRLAMAGGRVLVMEPQDALLTRLGVLLGVSTDREDAGNAVLRLRPCEVKAAASAISAKVTEWRRYVMYYPHQPGRAFRLFDGAVVFELVRAGFVALNATVGRFLGNKCHFVVTRLQTPRDNDGANEP